MAHCRTATPHSEQGDLRHLLSGAAAVGSGIIAGEITGSAVLGVFWALLADYVVMTLGALLAYSRRNDH
jgi:hypothetical protein